MSFNKEHFSDTCLKAVLATLPSMITSDIIKLRDEIEERLQQRDQSPIIIADHEDEYYKTFGETEIPTVQYSSLKADNTRQKEKFRAFQSPINPPHDWNLYPNNEAGAFDHLDQVGDIGQFN